MNDTLIIRNMTRDEATELVSWATKEGWNPGVNDADIFWATDQDAFIAAKLEGELIGGGTITAYDQAFGFIGFFIVKPEFRGRGLGNTLWQELNKRLRERLTADAAIGIDGVFDMQSYYAKGGYAFSHRDIRFQSAGKALLQDTSTHNIVPLNDIPFADVLAYDNACFPAPRPTFLQQWITQSDSLALGTQHNEKLTGFGVIRRCGNGFKIGPLFADSAEIAEQLFIHLSAFAPDEPVFLDVPENNETAMALARKYKMEEVFGCARMYMGNKPELADNKIFGVTTFELG